MSKMPVFEFYGKGVKCPKPDTTKIVTQFAEGCGFSVFDCTDLTAQPENRHGEYDLIGVFHFQAYGNDEAALVEGMKKMAQRAYRSRLFEHIELCEHYEVTAKEEKIAGKGAKYTAYASYELYHTPEN